MSGQPFLFFSAYASNEGTRSATLLMAIEMARLKHSGDISVARVDPPGHSAHLGMLHQLHCRPGIQLVALYDKDNLPTHWKPQMPLEPRIPDWARMAKWVVAVGPLVGISEVPTIADAILNQCRHWATLPNHNSYPWITDEVARQEKIRSRSFY